MNKNHGLRMLLTAFVFVTAFYRYRRVDIPLGPCNLRYESLAIGCSLASNGTFSDPFSTLPTGPTAHLAPLFPWMVSLVIRQFGNDPAATNTLQWMGVFILAFQLSLWPWVSRRLGMGFASGIIAAALWLSVGFGLDSMWEAAYLALLVLILVLCMHRILREKVSTVFVSLTSVLWGILFLLNPVPLLSYLALTIWVSFFRPIRSIQKLALIIIPLAVISPWLVRNYQVFHHFIPIRDNMGTELSLANNPCATFSFNLNRSTKCYEHPNDSVAEAEKVVALGEYEYNKKNLRDALAWIRGNPGKFAVLTKQRFLAYWFFSARGIVFDGRPIPIGILIVWAVTPLSAVGLWLLFKKDRDAAGLCLVWLVFFPPIYYVLAYSQRYQFPVLWAIFLPASFVPSEIARNVWRRLTKSHRAPANAVQSPARLTI